MRRTLYALPVAAALMAAPAAHARSLNDPFNTLEFVGPQDSCAPQTISGTLSLNQALDMALCHNPQTRVSWAQAKAASASLGQAQAAYLPTLDASAGAQYTNTRYSGNSAANSRQTNYNPALSLSYLITDFGKRGAQVDTVRHQLEQAKLNADSAVQSVLFSTIQAYVTVFSSQASVAAAKISEDSSAEALKAARTRLELGLVTPADTAQAQASFSQTQLTRQQAENTLQNARGSLAALLHIPPTDLPMLEDIVVDVTLDTLATDVKGLAAQALANRPDREAAMANEQAAEAAVRAARANNRPSLSLNASQGYGYSTASGSYDRDTSSVGVNLSFPLFTGFANTYNTAGARFDLEAARASRAQVEDNIRLDVWQSYHNFLTARDTYVTTQELLQSADLAAKLALGRYKAGKGSILELLEAQSTLASARQQAAQAQYNWLITRSDLARALGDDQALRQPQQRPAFAPAGVTPTLVSSTLNPSPSSISEE